MEIHCFGVLMVVLTIALAQVNGDGTISFTHAHIYVDESAGNAVLNVQRMGGKTNQISFSCKIKNSSASEDFSNPEVAEIFGHNDDSMKQCSFSITNDAIPEGNETFIVELNIFNSPGANLVNPKEAEITILANDKAYGVIGFTQSGTINLQEPSTHSIQVTRLIGSYGVVSVDWQIASGPDKGANDFQKTSGTISFTEGQQVGILTLKVKPDNIPENDEVFTLRLTSPHGGVELNSSFSDLQIRIPANDAPIRFPVTHITVPENISTISIQVFRGLQNDGVTQIGNIQETVTVDWYAVPINARPGTDFQNENGTVTFRSGTTTQVININIINDNTPELAENFTVHLKSSSNFVYVLPPGVATVTILPNDDQHGVFVFGKFPKYLDEDGVNSASFQVNRTAGTFGSASVSWKIVAKNGGNVSGVFGTVSGSLTFAAGDNFKVITVNVLQDQIPEEAAEYYVELFNPTGGSRLGNALEDRRAVFYVKDSDSAYGVVEFADQSRQKIIQDVSPRRLSLTLNRNGGTLRSITVNYTIEYHLPNSNGPSNSLGITPNGQITISAGQSNATIIVNLPNDGFIKVGSVFKVVLDSVKLEGAPPIVAPTTPTLGTKTILYLNISASNADGEIGFEKFHQTISVQEPDGLSPWAVRLLVVRDGTAGRGTAQWALSSNNVDFNGTDAGPLSGNIVFEKGQNAVNLTINILPDTVPELDEVVVVTLSNVSSPNKLQTGMVGAAQLMHLEQNNTTLLIDLSLIHSTSHKQWIQVEVRVDKIQRMYELQLRLGLSIFREHRSVTPNSGKEKATITIAKNDNPGGTFVFKNISALILKEGDVITFDVVRHGSALDQRKVAYRIIPAGRDFTSSTGNIDFGPSVFQHQRYIFVKLDPIPELDERFQLELVPFGPEATQGTIGSANVINITISENDDPYGIIEFSTADLVKQIYEKKGSNITVSFTVERKKGTFGSTDVSWVLLSENGQKPGLDIHPTQGIVSFKPSDSSKTIDLHVLNDVIPESNETFVIHLQSKTGKALFGTQLNATLTVLKNDDPVYFATPTHVNVSEGQTANLTIHRGGDGQSSITVTYSTNDGSARASDSDYVPVTSHVTFGVGEFFKTISISIPDDNNPEGVEYLTVKLINATGDTVIQNDVARVTIYASDAGTGVFQFADSPFNKTVSETGEVSFEIVRLIAQHGKVQVFWQVVKLQSDSGVDISPSSGSVIFTNGVDKQTIKITPLDENIAEMNETFALQIVNATGIDTGEDGRLGNTTVVYFTVLPNDDPYGLLRFADASKDVKIPEDYISGQKQTTQKNLTVVRNQGAWGEIEVLWEISTAPQNIKQTLQYDLLFLGTWGPGVHSDPSKRRDNTGTNVSCFSSARTGSYATVSLFGGKTLEELSMSSWLLPQKRSLGYILSYSNLEVAVNTTGSTSDVYLSLFNSNVTIDLGKDISDGNWHEIVVTMNFKSREAKFYVDGNKLSQTWKSFPAGTLQGGGEFTVGSSQPGKASYTGCIQDIRVYRAILEDSKIDEMYKRIPVLSPINGYLIFHQNVRRQDIEVRTVDNSKPEDETKFKIGLLTAKGGARLDSVHASTTLTVLKSDNANGLFGLKSTTPLTITEANNITITVDRSKGASGPVTVSWEIYKQSLSGLELATKDFQKSQGKIVFSDGDTSEIFYINPKDDQFPEMDENFVLRLVSATSNDGKTSSTPTSGASVDPNFTEINITITKNDYPYGLLQFMDTVPAANATILPAVDRYYKNVRESAGTLDLIVVRAQGTEGTVKCSWNIESQTAKSPDDYVNTAGDLTFLPGSRSAKISIELKDDDIPELNKTFKVVLYNPTGGVKLSNIAKVAEIIILPSDDAYGVMNFSSDSISKTVKESATVSLSVVRSGGVLGPVTIYWKAIGPHSNDITPMESSVDLATGQRLAPIVIKITNDTLPELSESYIITLVNVSKGRLAPTGTTSNITILASDHPYGVFQFDPNVIPTSEGNHTVTLVIRRTFGYQGTVKVDYKSLNYDDTVSNIKQKATPGQDFVATSGSLVFSQGVTNATISVHILDDSLPEDMETILVNLTGIEIIRHSAVVPVPINSPVLGRDHCAQIQIQRNDNASGVVRLSASSVVVTEPYTKTIVNVTRDDGAFGKVQIKFAVTSGSALPPDYRILSNDIIFEDGQRSTAIPVQIVDDKEPEKVEVFTIKLLSSGIQGGAVLGYPQECTVTIGENDYPYGLIGFDNESLNVVTSESTSSITKKVTFKVLRTYGTEGASTVHWEATYKNQPPTSDITPVRGDLVFPTGAAAEYRQKYIEIEILHDVKPETPEVIQITLTNVTFGKGVIDAHAQIANLTITANDDPHGVIEFTKSNYIAIEGQGSKYTMVYLGLKREFGTFGDVRVYYSTKGSNSSLSNKDFVSVTNGSITIPARHHTANITISIMNDSIPELNERFTVVLEAVELAAASTGAPPRLGSLREANVTILSNDDANGLFMIRVVDADPNTGGSVKTILEKVTSVGFEVIRTGGTIGEVTVTWTADPSSNATKDVDFKGDGASLTFPPGVTKKSASIQISDDFLPETDESIIISLTNPTNGAKVTTGSGNNVTIIISANDHVAGLIGFSRPSQSIVTQEGANVSLSVQRSKSAAGIVKVLWSILGRNASLDFSPYFGHVIFSPGQTLANITFQVRPDSKPEPDEIFMIELLNITTYEIAPSGAAELIPNQVSATLSVRASDEPHGVVEFQADSRQFSTQEANETIHLVVTRLFGMIGTIRVNYEIKAGNITNLKPGQQLASTNDFTPRVSSITINDGQSVGQIPVQILDENDPEIDEVFIANITGVELLSSPHNTSGLAPRLGQHSAAEVVIKSNDNPRGLLGFTHTKYYVNESVGSYDVIIERTQGSLGTISLKYYVDSNTAIKNVDFQVPANPGGEQTITFKDGVRKQNITVEILNDLLPEDDEMFRIVLKKTEDNTLRSGYTVTEVFILANDDARGVFSFETIKETIAEPGNGPGRTATFKVVRKVASLGEVVVGWKVLNDSASADLTPVVGNLTFAAGVRETTFTIASLLDATPEKDEVFQIGISIVSSTGGRVTVPSTATLIIAENDYPYGELEIVSYPLLSNAISVEETVGTIKAKVSRKKGNFGRISVRYETVPSTAVSSAGDVVHFETTQGIKTIGAKTWYSFSAYGARYLVLASNSSGDQGEYYGSSLYRWQGVFTKVQSIHTDGAVNWDSIDISGVTYLAVANYGRDGRTDAKSSIYRLDQNGHITVIKNISTKGASDVKFFSNGGQTYLVIANSKSDSTTILKSKVYRFQADTFVDQNADFQTRAASGLAVFAINGAQYLAVSYFHDEPSNSFKTKSVVLEWKSGSFQLYKEISTNGPIGVQHFEQSGEHFLVFGNSKSHATVHHWQTGKFVLVQNLTTTSLKSLYTYNFDGKAHLVIIEGVDKVKIYTWKNRFQLQMNTTVPGINSVYPLVYADPVAGDVQMLVAAVRGSAVSPVMIPIKLSPESDYIPRKGHLIFENGQTELELYFTILQDNSPEMDEKFSIVLSNTTGKAVIGPKRQLAVTILSNNNAHGRIGFSKTSLKLVQREEEAVVNFEVDREYGQFGRVVVWWNATGDFRAGEISPNSGALVFGNGEEKKNISITIHDDKIPELDKVIKIRLLSINETGSPNPGRGAVINSARALATLIIPGNDDPHGVFAWSNSLYLSQESKFTNKTITVTITRRRGLIGSVVVSYRTESPRRLLHSNEESAVAGVDYVSRDGQVVMADGVNETHVTFDVIHGNLTSVNKLFLVNITAVALKPESPTTPLVTNSPRVDSKARLLEVVISQTNQSLGELNFNVSSDIRTTEGSIVTLKVVRSGSLIGRVGCHYVIRPSTNHLVVPASLSDVTPTDGTLYFEEGQSFKKFNINVVDDGIPELEESFNVEIVRPLNGVRIGGKRLLTIAIQASDDPYGVFGFKVSPSEPSTVEEGKSVRLEVVRLAGTYGEVHVSWTLGRVTSQMTPYNGTITFEEGSRTKYIDLFAVDDSTPEAAQQFTCTLTNVDNNAKLNDSHKSAVVVISANDNAEGVISIGASTRKLFVGEPVAGDYDGVFTISVLRSIGQIGVATVNWKITKITPTASLSSETFNASTGSVRFTDGVKSIPVTLKVKDDANPEEFASYLFKIVSSSGAYRDNATGALEATIDVAASDYPYGLVSFSPPYSYNVTEDKGFVNLTIRREKGDIGNLKVNLSVTGSSATQGQDYVISSLSVDIANKVHTIEVPIKVIDDSIPELLETINVRIDSVVLLPTRAMNYSIINGLQPDQPPKIGSQNTVRITIEKNDNAHGVIQFKDVSKTIHEEDKQVTLALSRSGGTLGKVEVFFTVGNGSATFGKDYNISSGSVLFNKSQDKANVVIPIIDDSDPEQQESFTVTLVSVTGGATLGAKKIANVIIQISDNPHGLVGFVNDTRQVIPNPNTTHYIKFGIARIGGAQAAITVKWQLQRVQPSSGDLSQDFYKPYNGTLTFSNGNKVTQYIEIKVDAYRAPEPQEIYLIHLFDATGGAEIDSLKSNITLTILKHGFPNGIFKFKDTSHKIVDEPDTGTSYVISLPVERTIGEQGDVKDYPRQDGDYNDLLNHTTLYWKVLGSSTQDLVKTSGEVLFRAKEKLRNVEVVIKGDDVPELNETFTVMLYKVDGGADLDTSAQNVTITIRANDDPHGVFKLKSGAQSLQVLTLARVLQFTVQRDMGTFGDVAVNYRIVYSSWYPDNLSMSITVAAGKKEFTKRITLPTSAFLKVNSNFRITLTSVRYASSGRPAVVSSPKLSSSSLSETVNVPEDAANAVLRFAEDSLKLSVSQDNSATMTVIREGLFGDVIVTLQKGYPSDQMPQGFTAGQIEPKDRTLTFNGQTRNQTFKVEAKPVTPDRKLVYAVHLWKTTTSSNVVANITTGPQRTAVIEYSGVVEIAPDALSLVVTEGDKVTCRVVRLFSVLGSVRVSYTALGTSGSIEMAQGEYSKTFDVTSTDNNKPQIDYTFFINITQVTGSHSPRLGSKTVAKVTVKDNDNPNGIISFKTLTLSVPENITSAKTHKVSLTIQRTGGKFGRVSIVVRTVGGGEPWDAFAGPKELRGLLDKRSKESSAAVGRDYEQLLETVTFESGVDTKTIQLTIRDDDVPEPNETVYLYLANVTGGAVLGTSANKLQTWSVVTIEGNDLMNGAVGFVVGSKAATMDEDGAATVTLKIERTGANFGSVVVVWRVRELDKHTQLVEYQGTATFKPGFRETEFTLTLRKDNVPEFKSSFQVDLVELQNTQQAIIMENSKTALITVLASDYPYGMVGFASSSLYKPVNLKTTEVSLEVLRTYGNTTDVTLTYKVEMLPGKSTESGIATSQAVVGQDYQSPKTTTLRLKPGVTSATFSVTLTPETPSDTAYPKAFRIKIINVTNKAVINTQTSTAMVIISNDEDTTRFLALRASSRLSPLSDETINKILSDLKNYVRRPLNDDRIALTKDTIKNVLNDKKNRPQLSKRKLQEISKTTLMDIFDELLNPSRSDTKGRVEFAAIFDMFAFSLAYGESCPTTLSLGKKGKYAYATAYRKNPDSLNGLQLDSATGKHYFSYPVNMFIVVDNKQKSKCRDVHFIEYHTSHWFKGTVLNNKVLSTSLDDTSTVNKNRNPSTYKIYTGKKRVTPKGAKCVYWDFTKSEWSTKGCSVKRDKEDYVECQCNHMSNFAAQGQSDDRVGYSTYFFAACFVCLGAFALALLSHHACSVDNLFSAKLLMHMFFSCMAAHLLYVIGAYVSSSQAVMAENPPIRCSVLGMFLHYFFLCQFSWMFIQGWNLWRILVLNDEHTDRKYVLFFVLGWGMPVVAVVIYIIIAQAAFSWSLHDMYGDVHQNGDMCFIPNAYAALASVVAPTLLFLMGVAVVFTQAYQVTMQWRYYDDIYRGHYNIKEVRNIIILIALVAVTWVFAGLHLAYGYLWMIILFAIFDIILGLYVFILFFILRNQVRGVFKQTYAFRGEPPPPIHTHDDFFRSQSGHSTGSSKRFKTRPSPEVPIRISTEIRGDEPILLKKTKFSDWDNIDNMATPRSNRKLMINMDDTDSLGQVNDTFEEDMETQDFDDLIFALKTGGHFEPDDEEKKPDERQEHYELRRISIPDTHL